MTATATMHTSKRSKLSLSKRSPASAEKGLAHRPSPAAPRPSPLPEKRRGAADGFVDVAAAREAAVGSVVFSEALAEVPPLCERLPHMLRLVRPCRAVGEVLPGDGLPVPPDVAAIISPRTVARPRSPPAAPAAPPAPAPQAARAPPLRISSS